MARRRKASWGLQLIRITGKGAAAYRAGKPLSANPYAARKGNLQRQRAQAWTDGWTSTQREEAEWRFQESERRGRDAAKADS